MQWREIENLKKQLEGKKTAGNSGYYQIRQESEGVCQLAFSKTGPCGESVYQPLIKVRREADAAIPYYLLDLEAQPIQHLQRTSTDDAAALDQALGLLVAQFYQDLAISR
ncbi:hypothetical protein A5886_000827 [Enterococcus sp. 8G7_MSG3316]|uniref:Uncharacterized protein n=1 Tax=Candidatus Enterococcus testudinis TaxID=1834191 RepID=A0A242A4U0_9ENTE|nr:hypothetical protein [Enterococcus sp. 8G7_MSG3316]OTN75751.1 hypothetical protein A5886_000827 [Enterococcus sp. 8G7_MSG3316]